MAAVADRRGRRSARRLTGETGGGGYRATVARLAVEPPTWLDRQDEYDQGGEMPVAIVQDWAEGGNDTTGYDAIHERVMAQGTPDGFRMHAAGATPDGGFRIFEVWESQEHFDRFAEERLMPILRDIGAGGDPPNLTSYELHEYIVT